MIALLQDAFVLLIVGSFVLPFLLGALLVLSLAVRSIRKVWRGYR